MPSFEAIFSPVFVRGLGVFHGLRGLTGFEVSVGRGTANVEAGGEVRQVGVATTNARDAMFKRDVRHGAGGVGRGNAAGSFASLEDDGEE
jgi:hypothetical protein